MLRGVFRGSVGISPFTLLLIFLCLAPGYFSVRLCDTKDGRSEKLFAVFENEPNGTRIGYLDIITTLGADDKNASLRVIPSDQRCGPKSCDQWVAFDHETQELTLNVSEGQMLDKDGDEGVDTIEITIACSPIPSSKGYDINVLVTIKVDDVNDNTPQFVGLPYSVEVNELTPVGTSLLQISATDHDKTAHLSYAVVDKHEVWSKCFSIPRAVDGKIVLTKMLDYESLNSTDTILLDVEVVNRGRHGDREIIKRNKTTVKVKVLDGDDHPPRFEPCTLVSGVCINPTYTAYRQQGTFDQTAIRLLPDMLHATDPDKGIRQTILYSLLSVTPPGYENYFSVDRTNGEIHQRALYPPRDEVEQFKLVVKAYQVDNEDMYSIAEVVINVVTSLKDDFPPVIANGNIVKGALHPGSGPQFVFVSDLKSTFLQLEARDRDYSRDRQPNFRFTFIAKHSMVFEITESGYVIADMDVINIAGKNRFEMKVKVENTDAADERNRFGEPTTLIVDVIPDARVSELSRNENCTLPPPSGEANGMFIAAFGAFCGLFILCVPVIIYLVVQMRRYKAAARHGSQPYTINQSFGQKYDGFSFGNSGYRGHSDSFTSSGRTAVSSKRVLSESIERIGHMIKAPTVDDDIPHIAPLEAMKRAKKQKKVDDVAGIVPFRTNTPVVPQKWKDDVMEHLLNFEQIRVENWLSEEKTKKCGVGEVNLGSPKPCFVKILTGYFPDKGAASDDVSAMNQVLHYTACTHPNVVKFYGSCVQDDSLYIVNEFVSSRDLRNVLVSSRMLDHSAVISSLSGAQLLNFVIGIADGLFYLHDNGVLHAALRASNVRVNDSLTAKLSECCGETSQRFKLKSKRWMPPEVAEEQPYTEKSDVWSFGIVVWEILSLGGTPFDDQADNSVPEYVKRQISTGGSILPVTRNTTKRFWMLLQRCWAGDPLDRPNINDIKNLLCKMKANSNAITVAKAPGYRFFPASTA